ncbi:hypothetical protein EDD36DRAFT_414571 [Exophiala viscosa]|uniref:Uncharacterized protein n=1 Tax=Exophiala viscosa TaxID=2486360 RepID=A0AAN6E7F6_9EURO|nr:hypothetical protein EDD36DRAFT_414571 [Exophiala viscosa]
MADVHSGFDFNTTPHKRKRRPDHLDDSSIGRDIKRRSTHTLPFRLSPSRPHIPAPQAYSLFTSVYQQPPTPVDTSDEESLDQTHEEKFGSERPLSMPRSQGSSNDSLSSIQAQHGDSLDVDMDHTMTSTPIPKIRRARSNDIMPPQRDRNFLSAMDSFARERVPTPISKHFDDRIPDLPSVPRHQFPPLRTNLSPMFEQDSWITRDGLPSPAGDDDMDGVVVNDGMKNDEAQLEERYRLQLDGHGSPGRSRTARLHMGFLTDCDKCIQKVPGHYSHILWS